MKIKGFSVFTFVTALALIAGFVLPGNAQQGTILGSFRDWDALVLTRSNGEKICYMISIPQTKQPANVNHGDIYITVTHRPRRKVRDEVNFVAAYDFRTGSEVRGSIGARRFTMFTEGTTAWNYDQDDDRRMVQAMIRGNTLVLNAISSRGTNTSYRFSLAGFTAAYNAINRECS